MVKYFEKPVAIIALLAISCGYLFFFQLGSLALTDPDEPFYAQTAKEMLERDDWLTPHLYGKPQFEKPVLLYWLIAISYKVFGVNEFAARFPSALFGLLGVMAMYILGGLLFNKRVGILAAVILATNVEYIILSRACVTDMVLSTFMLFGVLFFFLGYLRGKGFYYILSSASLAFATLTKGPIAVILFGAVVTAYLLLTDGIKAVKKIPIFSTALVFLIIAGPWYFLMYRLHSKEFIEAFFGFHNMTRFLESEHKMGSQVYYNIPIMFGGFFPWSLFLPFGFWHMFKKISSAGPAEKKHPLFVLLWFFVIFVFFSASSTKLPTYIFPSFISLALITAVAWDDFLKCEAPRGTILGMSISYVLLLISAIVGAAGVLIFIHFDYAGMLIDALPAAVFLIFGFLLSLAAYITRKFIASFFFIAYAAALFLYPTVKLILPHIERYETSKEISRQLLSLAKPGEPIGSESHFRAGVAFYTNKKPADMDKHHVLTQFIDQKRRVWIVLKEKNHRQLYELEHKPPYAKPSYLVYKVGKRCIVTNKIPDDGKYIVKRERVR